ncbi:MAG: hypothetical protein M3Y24_05195 [Acidobacteriota bacterium]|nr:hypothetical protein [Acidobacteriota bacterium]
MLTTPAWLPGANETGFYRRMKTMDANILVAVITAGSTAGVAITALY